MTKEELSNLFAAKVGEPDADGNYAKLGISSRTLDAYLDGLSTLGTEVDEASLDTHMTFLGSMGGQLRKEKADFVKSYKPAEPEPKPKDEEKKPEEDEYAKRIESLQAKIDEFDAKLKRNEETANSKKLAGDVAARMKSLGAEDEYVLNIVLRGATFDGGKNANDLADELMSKYDDELRLCRGDGAIPRGNGGSGGSKNELAEYFAEKFAKQGFNKK